MKEVRYFFVPDADHVNELPTSEALHALRVLRLSSGDEMFLMDGVGNFYRAIVTIASTKHCFYDRVSGPFCIRRNRSIGCIECHQCIDQFI